jgi:hypothetical protein
MRMPHRRTASILGVLLALCFFPGHAKAEDHTSLELTLTGAIAQRVLNRCSSASPAMISISTRPD